MSTRWLLILALPALLLAPAAWADWAPGPEDCTVSFYETEDRDCEQCEWDECEDQFAGTDYSHVCDGELEYDEETGDEWPEHEIWCEPAPDEPAGPNCSTGTTSLLPPAAGLGLLLAGVAALWWTRRR